MKKYLLILFLFASLQLAAQPTNYDESKVPEYTLPDALTMNDGTKVTSAQMWLQQRRPELMEMFRHEMYGYEPGKPKGLHFELKNEDATALDGKATRKELRVWFDKRETHYMSLLIYVPNNRTAPAPAFVGINFKGNHTVTDDPMVSVPTAEQMEWYGKGYEFYDRAYQKSRWPIEYIIDHGYACATFCMSDIDPDFYDGFKNGVHGMFDKGQRDSTSWASISAWAWGLSRAMDYFETDEDIDHSKVAVLGHSRLAKTALWAGATDPRFAIVVANCPGCSGSAISRRKYGETLKAIQNTFPHWFCANYRKYIGKEEELPFDQHELVAMIAPRPVYVQSCVLDKWGDPKGEFLGLVNASSVYELFGYKGIYATELPQENSPIVSDRMGYHLRTGTHDIKLYDWEQYIAFADKFFRPIPENLDERTRTTIGNLRKVYPGGTIEIEKITEMSVYSPIGEYAKVLPECRENLIRLEQLKKEAIFADRKGRNAIAREAEALRLKSHSSRDNLTWNTSIAPTQSWKKNYPAYPQAEYYNVLEVRFKYNGIPRIEYLYFDKTDPSLVHHTRKDLLKMYGEYIDLQDTIDQLYREISQM